MNIRLSLPDGREVDVGRTPTPTSVTAISTSPSMMRSNVRGAGCIDVRRMQGLVYPISPSLSGS